MIESQYSDLMAKANQMQKTHSVASDTIAIALWNNDVGKNFLRNFLNKVTHKNLI